MINLLVYVIYKQVERSFSNFYVFPEQRNTIVLKFLWHTQPDFCNRQTGACCHRLVERRDFKGQNAPAQQTDIRFREHAWERVQFSAIIEDKVAISVQLMFVNQKVRPSANIKVYHLALARK